MIKTFSSQIYEKTVSGRVSERKGNKSLVGTFINECNQSFQFTAETNKKYCIQIIPMYQYYNKLDRNVAWGIFQKVEKCVYNQENISSPPPTQKMTQK